MLLKDQLGKVKMCNNVNKNLIKMLKFFITYLKMLRNLCMKVFKYRMVMPQTSRDVSNFKNARLLV